MRAAQLVLQQTLSHGFFVPIATCWLACLARILVIVKAHARRLSTLLDSLNVNRACTPETEKDDIGELILEAQRDLPTQPLPKAADVVYSESSVASSETPSENSIASDAYSGSRKDTVGLRRPPPQPLYYISTKPSEIRRRPQLRRRMSTFRRPST